jgi:uncharacterized membrane protein YeaQ/YmgE (transglycosylase-associated protein family)
LGDSIARYECGMSSDYGFGIWLLIGVAAGLLSSTLSGSRKFALSDLVVGAAGAAIGGIVVTQAYAGGGIMPSVLTALGGACLMLGAWRAMQRRPA